MKEDQCKDRHEVKARQIHPACHVVLFAGLLASAVWQRVAFKGVGYCLQDYPYFIMVAVSAAFVAIFGAICLGIVFVTGGWLPRTKTWNSLGAFSAIGFLNALQGVGMVLANPHVSGHRQALMSQAVIPFTLALSASAGSIFTRRQCGGVALIVAGLVVQLCNPRGEGDGATSEGPARWALLYLLAQLPVALAAVLQEKAFRAVPVNVFQMMFWASFAQLLVFGVLAPFGAVPGQGDRRMEALFGYFAAAWHKTQTGEAGSLLLGSIISMLFAQLLQALIVKYSSAAFAIICSALVLPSAALAFTVPWLVGAEHTEQLSGNAPLALGLVFAGVLVYRLGDQAAEAAAAVAHSSQPLHKQKTQALLSTQTSNSLQQRLIRESVSTPWVIARDEDSSGPIIAAGVGIVQCEYSNARALPLDIWEEGTLRENSLASP